METAMPSDYVLGHSDAELQRLAWMSDLLRPCTERMLAMAGIGPGMRVLDVGCGAGDVAMLAAGLVGPSGSVTGVDRSAQALALAAHRAESAGLPWIGFHEAAIEDFAAAGTFDAVIGRFVVIHQADPAAFLRAAARHVTPGGVLAFHEMNVLRPVHVHPAVDLWTRVDAWLKQALTAVAPNMDAGSRLFEHFTAAGLPNPELRCESLAGGGEDSPLYKYMADTLGSVLPVLAKLGVSAEEVGIDTLEDRLRAAAVAVNGQIEWVPEFLAVSRLP
jgi:ubiquinone/menaquinone biosynthesis C-methylase UbiE